jgi:hypothetical protein
VAIVFETLSGGLGVAIIAAALLVTVALEVIDQLAAPVTSGTGDDGRPRGRSLVRGLHVALVVLALAALAATAVRIFVVVR